MKTSSLVNNIFDRRQVRRLREKSICLSSPYDFLHRNLEEKLSERILEFTKDFENILIIGSKTTHFEKTLSGNLYFYDFGVRPKSSASASHIIGDEELLPFKAEQFDLIISSAHLHQVNEMKSCLGQLCQTLKPGGMILGAVLGEMSLAELRTYFVSQEIDKKMGSVPRLVPMLELKSVAQLLSACGFKEPVCDLESYSLDYSQLLLFAEDLRHMGETNIMAERQKNISSKKIKEMFSKKVPIELEYIFFAGVKG